MKRTMKVLALVLALVMTLTVSALAANYEAEAEALNDLGLLLGTGNADDNYQLGRVPTRTEAGIMLLRLTGLYEEAGAGEYGHPFSDVPAWASPYIGYMYEKGMTNGVSDTLFGAQSPCDLRMYATFVLRALGYDDAAGDFTYAEAVAFGQDVGIVDAVIADSSFMRDQMVAVSYNALFTEPKDDEFTTLLEKLVSTGAVDEDAASGYLESYTLMQELNAALQKSFGSPKLDMTAETDLSMQMTTLGETLDIASKSTSQLQMDFSEDVMAFANVTTTVANEETITIAQYIKDGYLYMNVDGEKVRLSISDDEEMGELMSALIPDAANLADQIIAAPPMAISSIAKAASGTGTVYTVEFTIDNAVMQTLIDSMLGSLDALGELSDLSIDRVKLGFTVNAGGEVTKYKMDMALSMEIEVEGITTKANASIVTECVINATGDKVTVKFPTDLNSYEDMG